MSTIWRDDLLLNFAIASSNVDLGATILDAINIDKEELLALAEVETELQTISGSQLSGNALWNSHAVHLSNLSRQERICVRAIL